MRVPSWFAKTFAISASLFAIGVSHGARADAIPPEQDACTGKAAGNACEDGGKSGTCVNATCTRLDYSRGTPPRSIEVPCVTCDTSAARPVSDPVVEPVVDATTPDTTQVGAEATPTTGTQAGGSGCAGGKLAGGLGFAGVLAALGWRRARRLAD